MSGFGYLQCIPAYEAGGELRDCPACRKRAYMCYSGSYDDGEQISPNGGHCWFCGFRYSQHCQHSEEEQAATYCVDKFPEVQETAERNWRKLRAALRRLT